MRLPVDFYTLRLLGTVIVALVSLQLVYFWSQNRRATWLLWWAAPSAMVAGTFFAYRDAAPKAAPVDMMVSNALVFATFWCIWQGTRTFERRRILAWPLVAVIALWSGLVLLPGFTANLPLRVALASLAMAGFSALAVHELRRGHEEELPSRRAATLVISVLAVLCGFRVLGAFFLPFPLGGLPQTSDAASLYVMVILIVAGSATVLMVSMSKERLEIVQRDRALRDPLTGLRNRRALDEDADRLIRAGGSRGPVCLMICDLDLFKAINDTYGHSAGDAVLVAFGAIAGSRLRKADGLYRLGGEEFCILLPGCDGAAGTNVAERIRSHFAQSFRGPDLAPPYPSVSIGVAAGMVGKTDLETLLRRADRALYVAKSRGRDRVVLARGRQKALPLADAPETVKPQTPALPPPAAASSAA